MLGKTAWTLGLKPLEGQLGRLGWDGPWASWMIY